MWRLLFTIVMVLTGLKSTSQSSSISIEAWIKQIENESSVRFFYDTLDIPIKSSLTQENGNKDISMLLKKLSTAFEVNYLKDELNNYFLFTGTIAGLNINNALLISGLDYSAFQNLNITIAEEKEKILVIGKSSLNPTGKMVQLSGFITSFEDSEELPSAIVKVSNTTTGTVSDINGQYALNLSQGIYKLVFQYAGKEQFTQVINLLSNGSLNVELKNDVISLNEVVISSNKNLSITGLEMGYTKISISTLQKIPAALGEVDVLKGLLAIPGVQSSGEGNGGYNVRGGNSDQNLILFNGSPIFNPYHFFGFFSSINSDVVKDIELFKSAIPVEFGGRVSSVINIKGKTGSMEKFTGNLGISPVTSRIAFDGPIIKGKTAIVLNARSTYSDWLLNRLPNSSVSNSGASFYDVGINLSHDFNEKNNLNISGYLSNDQFKIVGDTLNVYSNKNLALEWKSQLTNNLNGIFSTNYSKYDYTLSFDSRPTESFKLNFDIEQVNFKAYLIYTKIKNIKLNGGISLTHYQVNPGSFLPNDTESLVIPEKLNKERALENALFLESEMKINSRLIISAGLRMSVFNYLGAGEVFQYQLGVPKSINSITDTIYFKNNDIIQTYRIPEVRISANYQFNQNSSLKFSYNRLSQFLQTLSNTLVPTPIDIWKLSDPHLKPQIGDHYSIGYYQSFRGNTFEYSIESYYKELQNQIDFKSGAQIILNEHVETDLVNSIGRGYGLEMNINKKTGKLSGWVNYTYSRSYIKSKTPFFEEKINNGNYYRSNFDKPHAFNLTGIYNLTKRYSLSFATNFSTGRPITLPLAMYEYNGTQRVFYSQRNEFRIPNYFRADVSLNIEGNHKLHKPGHSSLVLGLYNLTGRKNVYSIFFKPTDTGIQGYQLSIFGSVIPMVTYNLNFR